jgi:hypothetical protein
MIQIDEAAYDDDYEDDDRDGRFERSKRHVARTIALYRARRNGWLVGKTSIEIADLIGVHRSTVSRAMQDIDEIDRLADEYLDMLAPLITKRAPE